MKLRVLHCIYDHPENPWVGGGGAVRVGELYRRLTGSVKATVACGSYPGARSGDRYGVHYVHLGARRPYAWSRVTYACEATRLLRCGGYDAAVFDFSTYTPILVPPDRPVGITVHHLSGPTARARWGPALARAVMAAERALIRRARWLSATSSATMEALRTVASSDASIELIYAGVPDELFTIQRQERGFLLFFGRLDVFQKGLDTLLLAMAELVRQRPALELRIAGRGKDRDRVDGLARRLGLQSNVVILGGVSDRERLDLLAGADVVLMPSRFEGFGLVAAEAMAAGAPVVASRAGSLPEVVSPPAGGVLVPPDDPAGLAAAVARLLENPARRHELSVSARRSAERFRWDAVAERHLAFLEMIAAGAPPAGRRSDASEDESRSSKQIGI